MEVGYSWNLSPKVVLPFLAGLIGFATTWAITGDFDKDALVILISTLAYGVIGVAVPPAPGVTQEDVANIPRR